MPVGRVVAERTAEEPSPTVLGHDRTTIMQRSRVVLKEAHHDGRAAVVEEHAGTIAGLTTTNDEILDDGLRIGA